MDKRFLAICALLVSASALSADNQSNGQQNNPQQNPQNFPDNTQNPTPQKGQVALRGGDFRGGDYDSRAAGDARAYSRGYDRGSYNNSGFYYMPEDPLPTNQGYYYQPTQPTNPYNPYNYQVPQQQNPYNPYGQEQSVPYNPV